MLFKLHPDTPKFQVFVLLNQELIHFLNKSIQQKTFGKRLFSHNPVGCACWDNVKNSPGQKDLTRDKFKKLFENLKSETEDTREQLHQIVVDNQDLSSFFLTPDSDLLSFLQLNTFNAFKVLAAHLYGATKDLQPIINAAGGVNIHRHFEDFRLETLNGNICKACGMKELASFRAGVPDGDQWRADYDHQLCKSKYPIFAVHPDNLIPLCDVCNQDAKKAKDLFKHKNGTNRLAFYPYTEEAQEFIIIEINNLHDPEPSIKVNWNTEDSVLLNKLNTWDDIYEIRRRVEGKFSSLEAVIEYDIRPTDSDDLRSEIRRAARPYSAEALKCREWAFWNQKLFSFLETIDMEPFIAKWDFSAQQADGGARYILGSI